MSTGQAYKKKRKTSIVYQPRRVTLTKNKRIHVLGMSLSQLNISISYKNRIKALLTNNRALAHALGQAHQEITLLKKEIFDLKKEQPSNIPRQVKSKLDGICQHMDGMVKLLAGALSVCNSDWSQSFGASDSNSETACYLPSRNSSNEPVVAQLCVREDKWITDMTTIEEQDITETENLPPILFSDDISTKQYKKVPSRSKSRSLSRPESKQLEKDCSSEYQYHDMDTKPKIDLQSEYIIPQSSISSEIGNTTPGSFGLSNTVEQRHSLEDQKESFDGDFAIQLDPHMLSQAVQHHAIGAHEQDVCIEEPVNQKPSTEVGFSEDSKTDPVLDNFKINCPGKEATDVRSSPALMNVELTRGKVSLSAAASTQSDGTQLNDLPVSTAVAEDSNFKELSQRVLELTKSFHEPSDENDADFVPKIRKYFTVARTRSDGTQLNDLPLPTEMAPQDTKMHQRVKELSQKVLELTKSFHEQSDDNDPDFVPKKRKSSRKAKTDAVPSTPKSRKRKTLKTTAKISKKKSKMGEVSAKQDIGEHRSGDLALGKLKVEPNQPVNKLPLVTKETNSSDGQLKRSLNTGTGNSKDSEIVGNEKLEVQRKSFGQHALDSKQYQPVNKSSIPKKKTNSGAGLLKMPLTDPEVVEKEKNHEKAEVGDQSSVPQQALDSMQYQLPVLTKSPLPLKESKSKRSGRQLKKPSMNPEDVSKLGNRPNKYQEKMEFGDQRTSVHHEASESKETKDEKFGKCIGGPEPRLEIRSPNANTRQRSTSLQKNKPLIGKLINPVNKQISGKKSSSGKENLTTDSSRQSAESNFDGQRTGRRQKNPVSYKEPSLIKKIRRE